MMPFAFQIPYDRKAEITNAVKEAFIGYIGNEEAVYAIERDLLLALASDPPKLTRAFLLWGPSSAGKTEMAKRIAGVMRLPFNSFAGATLKNVKQIVGQPPASSAPAVESIVYSLHVWPNFDLAQVRAWIEAWPHVGAPFEKAINEVFDGHH